MGHNATPGFTKNGFANTSVLALANAKSDGTGNLTSSVTIYKLLTADSTNGSYCDFARIMCVASAAATNTVATVIRFYVSTITTGATTAADTFLVAEVALPIISADSATLAQNQVDVPLGLRLAASQTLLVSTHAAAASNTTWNVTLFGGDF